MWGKQQMKAYRRERLRSVDGMDPRRSVGLLILDLATGKYNNPKKVDALICTEQEFIYQTRKPQFGVQNTYHVTAKVNGKQAYARVIVGYPATAQ